MVFANSRSYQRSVLCSSRCCASLLMPAPCRAMSHCCSRSMSRHVTSNIPAVHTKHHVEESQGALRRSRLTDACTSIRWQRFFDYSPEIMRPVIDYSRGCFAANDIMANTLMPLWGQRARVTPNLHKTKCCVRTLFSNRSCQIANGPPEC